MEKIYNLFSESEPPPSTHSVESANRILPLIHKYTAEAIRTAAMLTVKMEAHKGSGDYQKYTREYNRNVKRWAEKIHRLGAIAKDLWLVDFDTGDGYLCWGYPETRVEHFHPYESGFQTRKKIS